MKAATFLTIIALALMGNCQQRTFEIDYERDTYLMDGIPFRYISGSMHPMRVHPDLWLDRMTKIKAAGFNTLQFYAQWNLHEPTPGNYTFEGTQDIESYIEMAQSVGLYVIFRPGPYICGERDGGGLPFWLYRIHPDIQLRTKDPNYLQYVDRWWGILLPRIEKYLYQNGGPIILVQVENEYGSFALQTGYCDMEYMTHLVTLARSHLGDEVVLFTTDGNAVQYMECGKVPGAYATVDFGNGENVEESFAVQRLFEPRGPLVNSEFYPGWFDSWGKPHATAGVTESVKTLEEILAIGANVNVYMAHGGTNFGFESGSNMPPFQPQVTSYDYDALISESGDVTEKYFAFKQVIAIYEQVPDIPVNEHPIKSDFGAVNMQFVSTFFDSGDNILTFLMNSTQPQTFEDLNQASGFILYETTIDVMMADPSLLRIEELNDRGYVFVNQEPKGILSRTSNILTIPISVRIGDKLQILVENQGRINYGISIKDFKGIISDVILGSTTLLNWSMYGMSLDNGILLEDSMKTTMNTKQKSSIVTKQLTKGLETTNGRASFWTGDLIIPCGQEASVTNDTFLQLPQWSKGVAFINGFNLGRYWPIMGPQMTLYVPAPLLKCDRNTIVLFELEEPGCEGEVVEEDSICTIMFVDHHEIDGPTPSEDKVSAEDVH